MAQQHLLPEPPEVPVGQLHTKSSEWTPVAQQMATESQAVVHAVVDRVDIHCTRLH